MVYHQMMGLCQDHVTCLTFMYITLCTVKVIRQVNLLFYPYHMIGVYRCMKCSVVFNMGTVSSKRLLLL